LRVIPVIDILGGRVVHGYAGMRERYRPIRSRITTSVLPLDVARDLLRVYPFSEIYVADLDAIQGKGSSLPTILEFRALGYSTYVDLGIRRAGDVTGAVQSIDHLVVGTETLDSLAELGRISDSHPSVVVSLDFKSGNLLTRDPSMAEMAIEDLIHGVSDAGASEIIYLELSRVGTGEGAGPSLEGICRASPIPVLVGGGIRGPRDVAELSKLGVSGVLVATCIHSGEMTGGDIEELTSS